MRLTLAAGGAAGCAKTAARHAGSEDPAYTYLCVLCVLREAGSGKLEAGSWQLAAGS